MARPFANKRPTFLIIAGPNGSGKSSFYADAGLEAFGLSVWIVNPDLLSARISDIEGRDLTKSNVEAVRRIESWLEASISIYQSVGVETVLSTPKYRRLVEIAKNNRFLFRMIYVLLENPDLNVHRVNLRVRKGGHFVPEHKIRQRFDRSLQQLPWFWAMAYEAWLFDNSDSRPSLLAERRDDQTFLAPHATPRIAGLLK